MRKRAFRVANGSLTEVIRQFMLSDKFLKNKPGTIENNRHLLSQVMRHELGEMRVESIRPSHVQAYLDTMADRPGARSNALVALKALQKWAIVRDKLPHHITTGAEAPRDEDENHTPWPEELVELAEKTFPTHMAKVVTLGSNTGQRGSDLVNMRWSDIATHDGYPGINVKQKKTGLEVWVPFTPELLKAMEGWERRPGYMLFREDGTKFEREHLSCRWLRLRRQPGMEPFRDLVLHGLRGSAVVRLRKAGCSQYEICSYVGMSPKMVSRYSKKAEQIDLALAAVRRMKRTDAGHNGVLTPFKGDLRY